MDISRGPKPQSSASSAGSGALVSMRTESDERPDQGLNLPARAGRPLHPRCADQGDARARPTVARHRHSHSVMRRGNSYSLYLLLCLIGLPVMNQSWTNRSSGISSWTKSKKWAFNVNSHYMKFAGKGRVAIAAPSAETSVAIVRKGSRTSERGANAASSTAHAASSRQPLTRASRSRAAAPPRSSPPAGARAHPRFRTPRRSRAGRAAAKVRPAAPRAPRRSSP